MANANHTRPESIPHTLWNLPVRSTGRLKPNRCGSRLLLATVICSPLGTAAYADLPLTLEEVIAKKDEVTVELGFNYGNLYTGNFVEEVNQDVLSMSLRTCLRSLSLSLIHI